MGCGDPERNQTPPAGFYQAWCDGQKRLTFAGIGLQSHTVLCATRKVIMPTRRALMDMARLNVVRLDVACLVAMNETERGRANCN